MTLESLKNAAVHSTLDSRGVTARLDSAIIATIFVAVAMPLTHIDILRTGPLLLTVGDFPYIFVTGLLLLRIVVSGKVRFAGLAAFTASIVFLYTVASLGIGGAAFVNIFHQLRFYWPFAIALLTLMADVRTDYHRFVKYAYWAGIISAGSALLMQYYLTDYLDRIYADSPETLRAIASGRMVWDNEGIVLFLLLFFVMQDKDLCVSRLLGASAVVLGIAASFSTQTRTIMAGNFLIIGCAPFVLRRRHNATHQIRKLLIVIILMLLSIGTVVVTSNRVRALATRRYLATDRSTLLQRYQTTMDTVLRVMLYQQYWKSLSDHFPLGQGLGQPYSEFRQMPIWVVDISPLAFALPFGMCGIAIYGWFILALWQTATNNRNALQLDRARAVKLLIVISLLVSLNEDLYSRNIFVILLTMLVLCKDRCNGSSVGYCAV